MLFLRRVPSVAVLLALFLSVSPSAETAGATPAGDRSRVVNDDQEIVRLATATLAGLERHRARGDGYLSYIALRDVLASHVAADLGLDAADLQRAWRVVDYDHQQALLAGLTQLGVPYRRNTSNPGSGFDCSGLTLFAWGRTGLALPRQSGAQIKASSWRSESTARAGDLVQYPGHIMMWLGAGRAVLQSRNTGATVELAFVSGRRELRFGDPTG